MDAPDSTQENLRPSWPQLLLPCRDVAVILKALNEKGKWEYLGLVLLVWLVRFLLIDRNI